MTSGLIGGVPHPEKFLDSIPGGYGVTGCDPATAAPQRELFASPLLRAHGWDQEGKSAGMLSGFEAKVATGSRSGNRRPEERCIVLPLQRGRPRFFSQHRFKPRD